MASTTKLVHPCRMSQPRRHLPWRSSILVGLNAIGFLRNNWSAIGKESIIAFLPKRPDDQIAFDQMFCSRLFPTIRRPSTIPPTSASRQRMPIIFSSASDNFLEHTAGEDADTFFFGGVDFVFRSAHSAADDLDLWVGRGGWQCGQHPEQHLQHPAR